MMFSKGSEHSGRGIARTAEVSKNRGWFGGPDAQIPDFPLENTVIDQELFEKLRESFTRCGYRGATSWYLNHSANRNYGLDTVDGGILRMPVLFIHTEYDAVCQSIHNPKLMEEMRSQCDTLQGFVIKAGHWGMLELPTETNASVIRWLLQTVGDSFPGPQLRVQI